MNSPIVIALVFGVASVISSLINLGSTAIASKNQRLTNKIETLFKDLDFFYSIEEKLIDELSQSTGKNTKSIKKEIRALVSSEKDRVLSGYSKPSEIKKHIN